MEEHGIVPDVISIAPKETVKVTFARGITVDHGNELKPIQVRDIPEVTWNADAETFYTLCLIDPDAPGREHAIYRCWQHWLVVNIPGTKVVEGDTLSEYIGSGPGRDTGLHRYVFLVYRQNGRIDFDEKRSSKSCSREERRSFRTNEFAEKYQLGNPVAGNFYLTQWHDD
ncbi:protein D2-like [Bradysia coprophila]|uniref:protein D2-like n=1 Tax=Bradysia coprophila TaxID=38358 RepID=UPI00187DBC79|nr:protein D2-like [Bradysia coprophila]